MSRVVVLGGGGREHALAWKLAQSHRVEKIYCLPGNGGTATMRGVKNVAVDPLDFNGVITFCRSEGIELVVVGPEAPLAAGIVDCLSEAGIKAFGPTRHGALLESSKAYAKEFMRNTGLPTARFQVFEELKQARSFCRAHDWARVIKVDGLAMGKGVFVLDTIQEVDDALEKIFSENAFGEAGRKVVVEEKLTGEELSLMMFLDGRTISLMVQSQDHKRRFDGDKGPNTGGMGAYAPADVPRNTEANIEDLIVSPLRQALSSGALNYKGVLYAGLMIDRDGMPQVLEFNCRFGDPETEVVLPLLQSDLYEILMSCVEGSLAQRSIAWSDKASCCVVAVAGQYPESSSRGEKITIGDLPAGVILFHAGTALAESRLTTNGGRVVVASAVGQSLTEATDLAYAGIERISFQDMDYRKDIARRALSACQSK